MGKLQLSDAHHLRLLAEDDAAELYALIEANRTYLAPWMPWAAGQTLEQTIAFIQRARDQLDANNGFQAAVVEADEGEIVGVVGYHAVDWGNRSASIGYWLAEDRQGEGTMTQAVRLMVDHAFSAWELNRVEIRASTENLRSRAIPERLGFDQEGTLRRAERIGGRYLDSVVYAALAADWTSIG